MNHPIITSIPRNLMCINGPYYADYAAPEPEMTVEPLRPVVECNWESARDASDTRPTFAQVMWAKRKATGQSFKQMCSVHGVNEATCNHVRHAMHVPSPAMQARLAAMVDMQPGDIRWPIHIKEAHHE